MWRRFAVSLSFLTIFRLPVSGEITPRDSGGSYAAFPIVGFLVGLVAYLFVLALHSVMPPLLLAVWACACMTLVTRGFHLDGLADLADGLGGGYTPQRRLEIMKDSATGAFGSIALILAILIKTCALYSLIATRHWLALASVPALGRLAIVVCAYKSSCARSGGLAGSGIEHITGGSVIAAAMFAVVLALPPGFKEAPILLVSAVACGLFVRYLAHRSLGGVTGDVLGSANEITEVVLFTLSACLWR
ncbi:MAG: adenosylcobinamide-GDP ribazoletransferase [Syntrophobacteraceae bacterium]|nr:adenosylcobinamide-GDP ribazoletransferase [Syntrophobacteraceae bacterium]